MLDRILDVLGNAHFEAYVGGPLAGLVAGCIFGVLGPRPPGGGSATEQSPQHALARLEQSIRRASRVSESTHHHHHYGATTKSRDDGATIVVVAGLLSIIAMFLFGAFLPRIAFVLNCFISFAAVFSMTTSLLGLITDAFNTANWWRHSVCPFLTSIGCLYVAAKATVAISPEVVAFAQGLLAEGPLSLGRVLRGAITFAKALHNDYVHWILLDMLAFIFVATCAVLTLLQCVYYVALSNTRLDVSDGWVRLALATSRFGNLKTLVTASGLLLAAWFLAAGDIYQLVHR